MNDFLTLANAAAAIEAKGYRTAIRPDLNGPNGKTGGVYVYGAYVNKYLYATIDDMIAAHDVDALADATRYVVPETARRAG